MTRNVQTKNKPRSTQQRAMAISTVSSCESRPIEPYINKQSDDKESKDRTTKTTGWAGRTAKDVTGLTRNTSTGSVIPARRRQESISRRHCTISKGGEATQIVQSKKFQKPRGFTHPTGPTSTTTTRRTTKRNDESSKSHKRGTTTLQQPQHQKANEHILAARV